MKRMQQRARTARPTPVPPSTPAVLLACLAAAAPVLAAPTLHDVAIRYERLETRLDAADDPVVWRDADERVGALSPVFFSGRLGEAMRRLDGAALALVGVDDDPRWRAAAAFGARSVDVGLGFERLYPSPVLAGAAADVLLRSPAGDERRIGALPLDAEQHVLEVPATDLVEARHDVLVRIDDRTLLAGHLLHVDEPLATTASGFRQRLDGAGAGPELEEAVRRCRARIEQLARSGDARNVTSWALDPVRLRDRIGTEITAIEAGRDPYRAAPGDQWLPLRIAGVDVPCRILAPPSAIARATPPLLIALHGAGGNEHLFLDGHGGGRLARLASRHGFIVVAPRTTAMLAANALPDLLEQLASIHRFDSESVRLIGHSLGAMTSGMLSARHADLVDRAVLIAGGPGLGGATRLPPLLYIGAERDAVIPERRVRASAEALAAAGFPVAYRRADGLGHVLVVGAVLDEAIEWLMNGGVR